MRRERENHTRALAHLASPGLAGPWRGEARRGEAYMRHARVVFPFSSHTPLRVVERTHYIKRPIAISEISKPMCKMASGGAKFSPTLEVEEELDLFI